MASEENLQYIIPQRIFNSFIGTMHVYPEIQRNHQKQILGYLAGVKVGKVLTVTELVFPYQFGTRNSVSDKGIYDKDSIEWILENSNSANTIVGWIQTQLSDFVNCGELQVMVGPRAPNAKMLSNNGAIEQWNSDSGRGSREFI